MRLLAPTPERLSRLALTLVCATAGCFSPTWEARDGGVVGPEDAGGGADGGTGGGSQAVGLISSPGAITQAQCRGPRFAADCASDAGTCLVLFRPNLPPLEVLSQAQLGTLSSPLTAHANDDWYLFTTGPTVAGDRARLVAVPSLGGPAQDLLVLQRPTDRFESVFSAASSAYGTWFIAEVEANGVRSSTLYLARNLGPTLGLVGVAQFLPPPVTEGVALDADYFVAFADGVWGYDATGGHRLVQASGVNALAASAREVVFSTCEGTRCAVHRFDRWSFVTTPLLPPAENGIGSVAIVGGDAWALGPGTLTRIPLTHPDAAEVVFRGGPNPAPGTLDPRSLKVDVRKVSVGALCSVDPDAREYGTIELDLTTRSARWLNLDPAYPFLPDAVFFPNAANHPALTRRGLYQWTVR